jgi:N-acyl-D-aspartate/D-glutamate deacylase
MFRRLASFAGYVIGGTYSAANAPLEGRSVADIAAERSTDPFDTLIDIVIADELRTVLWPTPTDDDDAHWALRADLWKDPDVLLGGSDAGAHLDRMCGGSYPTQFLADTLRGRQLVTLEQAVHMVSGAPADLFGLVGRGHLVAGASADIVLFDPETVGAAPATLVHDLPGGAARLTSASTGVHRVFVNGVAAVADGVPTGALSGTALRSGRHTATVTCR